MEVTIRPARPEDVPAMLELVRELAVFEKEPEAVTVTEAEMLDAGFGKKPVWWGWVAEGLEESEVGSR
ncbi:MAG: GNAT family N-acetyltransferase, partial [Flavobacteriales bacterium]|nr:GNAT family N-acetyltransferase [Flavobacteriales bacterium]